jgi:aurora kinase
MDLLKTMVYLKEPIACHVIRDVVMGVKTLHEEKLIHRDIKPENILLTDTGRAKLADFGWSNTLETDNISRKTFCGTPDYLAPEMIQELDHDDSVDLWCIGILIYELLFGKPPFSPPGMDPNSYEYQKIIEKSILKLDYSFPKNPKVSVNSILPRKRQLTLSSLFLKRNQRKGFVFQIS